MDALYNSGGPTALEDFFPGLSSFLIMLPRLLPINRWQTL